MRSPALAQSYSRQRTRWTLLALLGMSFVLRAAFLVVVSGVGAPLEGDERSYHSIAASFAGGHGWVDFDGLLSYRPPFTPLLLAGPYLLAGPDPTVARWTMVVVSSLTAPLLFLVARQLAHGRTDVALVAAGAWAFYPPSIFYASLILTESSAALLLVGGLGAFLWAARSPSRGPVLLTGAIWALIGLNRPVYLLLPLFLLGAQVAVARFGVPSWRWSWSRWALGLAAFVLVMMPWTVRNYVEHGAFIPGSSNGGWVLLISNGTLSHPDVQAGKYYKSTEAKQIVIEAPSEAAMYRRTMRAAIDSITEDWRLLPRPLANRAINFWTPRPDPFDAMWTRNDWIMLFVWGSALLFFLVSFRVIAWRHTWPALAMILYAFLTTLLFWGTPRFRFPVDAIIVILAGVGALDALRSFAALWRRISETRQPA